MFRRKPLCAFLSCCLLLVALLGGVAYAKQAGSSAYPQRAEEDQTIALEVCQAVVAASKRELPKRDDPISDYAHHLVADGMASGHALPEDGRFHGYHFRVLPQNSGGAGLVAYPASYRVTGVMTFVVTRDGSIYEKDLGTQTTTLARQIEATPTGDWKTVH